jgi:hypothetical protein
MLGISRMQTFLRSHWKEQETAPLLWDMKGWLTMAVTWCQSTSWEIKYIIPLSGPLNGHFPGIKPSIFLDKFPESATSSQGPFCDSSTLLYSCPMAHAPCHSVLSSPHFLPYYSHAPQNLISSYLFVIHQEITIKPIIHSLTIKNKQLSLLCSAKKVSFSTPYRR